MGKDLRNDKIHGTQIQTIPICWICVCLCLLLSSGGRTAAVQEEVYPYEVDQAKFALTESAILVSSSERTSNAIPEAEEDTLSALAKYAAKKYEPAAAADAMPEQLDKPYPYYKSQLPSGKIETHPDYPVHQSKRSEVPSPVDLGGTLFVSAAVPTAESEDEVTTEIATSSTEESIAASTAEPTADGDTDSTTASEAEGTSRPETDKSVDEGQSEKSTIATKGLTVTEDSSTTPVEETVTASLDSETVQVSVNNTQNTVNPSSSTESATLSTEAETERLTTNVSTVPLTSTSITIASTSQFEKFTTDQQDTLTDKNLISTILQEEPSTITKEEPSILTTLTKETTVKMPASTPPWTSPTIPPSTIDYMRIVPIVMTTMMLASTTPETTMTSTLPDITETTTLASPTTLTTTATPTMLATRMSITPRTSEATMTARVATTAMTLTTPLVTGEASRTMMSSTMPTTETTVMVTEKSTMTSASTPATATAPTRTPTTSKPTLITTVNSETYDVVTSKDDEGASELDSTTPRTEDVTYLIRIVFEGSWQDVCSKLSALRKSLADLVNSNVEKSISSRQIIFHQTQCSENIMSTISTSEVALTSLLVYIVDENGSLDVTLTKILPSLYEITPINFPLKIHSFLPVQEIDTGNALIIIVVSCVAFICLILLAVLLFIMRKRQGRFNYGERCRPVSLDAYSLDSVSAYNSVRRNKGALRASKRSYGNPTFEDSSAVPSHPLNFSGLSNFVNDTNAISEEFGNIPQVASNIDELPPGAELKNRYANVIPLPETRVPLQSLNNDPHSEYINASYVRGPKNANKYYIACQAPTENTVSDFWRMIWEQQSKVIIMLTDLVENGVEKCTEYIPPLEISDCHRLYGDYQVTLKKREAKDKYAISTLHLKNLENNTFREVSHIWYLWPTNGCPTDATALIAVLLEARALQRGAAGPVVIHCSPGTGRTGTLIALDLGIRQYEITRTIDVPRVVYTIRRDRAGAVQTRDQYTFIYKALNLYASKLAGGPIESV